MTDNRVASSHLTLSKKVKAKMSNYAIKKRIFILLNLRKHFIFLLDEFRSCLNGNKKIPSDKKKQRCANIQFIKQRGNT